MLSSKNRSDSHFHQRNLKFKVQTKNKIAQVPKNALIEITNACNHACVFCYNPKMKRSINKLDFNIFKKFIESCVKEQVQEIGLHTTGEPFMVKNLEDYISFAKKSGIRRVYVTSNGALATLDRLKKCIDAGLDSIKFSINAATRNDYKITHGHDDFEKVSKNLKDLYNYKISNNINIQMLCSFVYTNLTHKNIPIFKKNLSRYFDEVIYVKALNQGGRGVEVSKKLTNKLKNNKDKFEQEIKPCEMLWNRLHLTVEGYLTACCVDYENDLIYTKLTDETLYKHFNSPKMQELREKHLKQNLKNTICESCVYNTNSKYVKLKNVEVLEKAVSSKKIQSLKNRISKI